MTALAHRRLNTVLALTIPAAGFLYLTSSGAQTNAFAIGVTLALGALWLAAVVTVNTRPVHQVRRPPAVVGLRPDVPPPPVAPAYVVNVSRPVQPWRWTSVLLAPLEVLAVAWSVPVIILLIMLPVGLALAGVLRLVRLLVDLL